VDEDRDITTDDKEGIIPAPQHPGISYRLDPGLRLFVEVWLHRTSLTPTNVFQVCMVTYLYSISLIRHVGFSIHHLHRLT